jgi:uncharacterized protein YqkB
MIKTGSKRKERTHMMYVKVDDKAQEIIKRHSIDGAKVVLNMVDGIGPFAKGSVSCDLGTRFEIIFVDKDRELEDYGETIDSDLGKLYIKPYTKDYLDEKDVIKVGSLNNLILAGEYSGEIDPNVNIRDER